MHSKKIKNKGGTIDENGISMYPRTSGEVQKIGSDFWRVMREINTAEIFQNFYGHIIGSLFIFINISLIINWVF